MISVLRVLLVSRHLVLLSLIQFCYDLCRVLVLPILRVHTNLPRGSVHHKSDLHSLKQY